MPAEPANTLEADRRAKLDRLRALGVNPFGGREDSVTPLAAARAKYDAETHGAEDGPAVKIAGRIMLKRDLGKLSFLTLRDGTGDLQVGLNKARLPDLDWSIRDNLDLGDTIVVEGKLGQTKTKETTVWATALRVASKSLLTPPGKWDGLSDIESRYRQRYVDLWANPETMELARKRIRIVDEIRSFLRSRGFVEVETPMLQRIHGGAAARPFKTHHNALDLPLYLRIAPELYLKRLLVGGMGKVFEINRNFRNEGISPRHNPEFTMLEAYEAFGSWETMAALVEEMICEVAQNVFGTDRIEHRTLNNERVTTSDDAGLTGDDDKRSTAPHVPGEPAVPMPSGERTIHLARPWRRATLSELVHDATGWKFDKQSILEQPDALAQALLRYDEAGATAFARQAAGLQLTSEEERHAQRSAAFRRSLLEKSPAEQLVEIYEKLVEPNLIDPTFVTRFPGVVIPLARRCADDDYFADVYELAINGQEISPGYTELNDPDVQAEHFRHQVGDRAEQQQTDDDFLTALKYGMPPAGGLGLGIDRLVMMLTGAPSIRDVILFPLMRPQS